MPENGKNTGQESRKKEINDILISLREKYHLTPEEEEEIKKGITKEQLQKIGEIIAVNTLGDLSDDIEKIVEAVLQQTRKTFSTPTPAAPKPTPHHNPESPPSPESEPSASDFSRQLKEILTSTEGEKMLERLAGKTGNERLWMNHGGKRYELKLSEDHRNLCRDILEKRYRLSDLLGKNIDLRIRIDTVEGKTWKDRWKEDRYPKLKEKYVAWKEKLDSKNSVSREEVCNDVLNALGISDDQQKKLFTENFKQYVTEEDIKMDVFQNIYTHIRNALHYSDGWKKIGEVDEAKNIRFGKNYENLRIRTWEKIAGSDDKNAARNRGIFDGWETKDITVYQYGTWKLASAPTADQPYYAFNYGTKTVYVEPQNIRICLKQVQETNAWKLKEPHEFQLLILEKPVDSPPGPPQPTPSDNPPPDAPPIQPDNQSPSGQANSPLPQPARQVPDPLAQNKPLDQAKDVESKEVLYKNLKRFFSRKRYEALEKAKHAIIILLEKGQTVEILQKNLLQKDGGIYDFLAKERNQQSVKDNHLYQKLVKEILVEEYEEIIKNAMNSYKHLVNTKKYSKDGAIKLLKDIPLVFWPQKIASNHLPSQ